MAQTKTKTKNSKRIISPSLEASLLAGEQKGDQVLKPAEQEARDHLLQKLVRARNTRDKPHREFDDMDYMQDYVSNLDSANTYLAPKRNRNDVRINTPTTEKKIEAVSNELLAMNISAEVLAFDKNDKEIVRLGKDFEDITLRTNQIEKEDGMWADMVRELLTQRAVFVEECVEKVTKDGHTKMMAVKKLVPGRKVYLGNINLPAYKFNQQPFYFTYDVTSFQEAEAIFGDLEAWNHVNAGGKQHTSFQEDGLYKWRLHNLENTDVEIIKYYSTLHNEHQVIINGVLMYPGGAKLPWKHFGYNMVMTNLKTMRTDFAYGKPLTASAKTLQGLENEMVRNMIRKFRQALEPPLGVSGSKIYGRQIWEPGAVTGGVHKNNFSRLIDHQGVTQSEFQMFNLISEKTEEFIGVSRNLQGLSSKGEQTATETLEQLRQGIKMLGMAVLAVMRMRRDLTYLRIYTVLEKFSGSTGMRKLPSGKLIENFQEFTVNNVHVGEGRRGKRIIRFQDRPSTPAEEQAMFDEEKRLEKRGEVVRFRTVDVKELAKIPVTWWVNPIQKEREGSALDKLMNQQKLAQVAAIEKLSNGQVKGNWTKLAEDTEAAWRSSDLFQTAAPQALPDAVPPEEGGKQGEAQSLLKEISQLEGAQGNIAGPKAEQLMEPVSRQTRTKELATQ